MEKKWAKDGFHDLGHSVFYSRLKSTAHTSVSQNTSKDILFLDMHNVCV